MLTPFVWSQLAQAARLNSIEASLQEESVRGKTRSADCQKLNNVLVCSGDIKNQRNKSSRKNRQLSAAGGSLKFLLE